MKIDWDKMPSVWTGGKPYFYNAEQFTNWDRPKRQNVKIESGKGK